MHKIRSLLDPIKKKFLYQIICYIFIIIIIKTNLYWINNA